MTTDDSREGERRHVTVMFADVSGFTAMARSMDPEDVTELMNECFGILETAVVEHGGHIDKYIGDCVMALFGAPAAIEDAPRQAVNASIAILERVAAFTRARGIADRIDVHVGINTGLVVYGDVGGAATHDTTAMGDTVNVASRLGDAAGAQAIYVGPQTRHETVADFRYRKVRGLHLKGVSGTFEAWEVLSREPRYHRSIARHSGPDPFSALVGREKAMAALEGAAERLERGKGGIVVITGEAGLGKTRLMFEMKRFPRLSNATFVEGRALRIGESPGLHAFADMLRSWVGLDRGDSSANARKRTMARLRDVLGDASAEVYPFLATMAGLALDENDSRRVEGIDPEGMQRLITRGVRDLLEALAAADPLVVMFDDLHWADQSTIDLLLRVLDLARRHRLLFVLAFRPDEDRPSMALLRTVRERYADCRVEVPLERLDPKASVALLRERIRFDDRPDQTRRAILSRAEGNPFFIEEIIRSLIDIGVIQQTPEGLRVTEHIAEVEVPGTVQELLMDRVDRLPGEKREVLQSASVVGRSFLERVLEAVVAHPAELDAALMQIVQRGFLEVAGPETGGDFAFRHALAHETVYEGILRRKRRQMHAAVGASIENLFAERLQEHYASLAYHFSRAEDWGKASFYLMRAGDDAARSAASSEALRYFTEAAAIHDRTHGEGQEVEARAAIEKKLGLACLSKGDLPAALDHIDRALGLLGYSTPTTPLQIARRIGADLAAILVHLYLGAWIPARRQPPARIVDIAELCFHKGKAQSTTAPQGYVVSMLPAIRAVGAWDFRKISHACGVYSAGAALFAWSGLSFRIARRMSLAGSALVVTVPDSVIHGTMLFVALYLEGDWAETNTLPESLVEDGLRYGAFWEVNTYLGMHCERRIHQGRFVEAVAVIDRIAEIGERYGYEFSITNVCAMRTFLLFAAGRLDLALAAVDRYYEVCNEEPLNLLALATRARILLAAGRHDAAAAAIEQGERLSRVLGRQAAPYHLAPLRVARLQFDVAALAEAPPGHVAERRALRHAARRSRRAALRVVAGIARDRPACFRAVASLEWTLGRRRAARRWWERALREAEARDALPEVAAVCREAGERLLAAGRGSDTVGGRRADDLLARALELQAFLEAEWQQVAGQFGEETSRG